MKIYARNESSDPINLDRFIGKNVWIKVHTYMGMGYRYIRVLSKIEKEVSGVECYEVNWVPDALDDDLCYHCSQEYYDWIHDAIYEAREGYYALVEPIECYTDTEFFKIDE